MNGTLVVAAREVAERKLLFLGALVAGLLPLGFPLLPVLRGNSRDARSVAVLLLAATIAVAFPLVFGATILVGDIAQKRLGFYFSRPLPAASIWAGKLLGALLISVGCAFLAAAPVIFVEGESAFSSDTGGLGSRGPLVLVLPGVLVLFLLAHVVASMARLRSAWIVLDFILAVVFAVAIALSLRGLFLAGFWDLYEMKRSPESLAWWLTAPIIAALLAASYVQVADGRTDARRSHGALSATLWGLMALLAFPLAGLAWWVNAATPKDLVAIGNIQAAPHGPWVSVSGRLRARGSAGASFLYDTGSGRFIKRPVLEGEGVTFSADGTRAVWLQGTPGFFEWRRAGVLRIGALAATEPAAIVSDIETNVWAQLALSPSGRRVAVFDGNILAAYEVSDPSHPRQLLALRIEKTSKSVAFVGEDLLRLFPRVFNPNRKDITPRDLEIEEISLLSKKSLVTGRLESGSLTYVRLSADGRYLVGTRDKRLTLRDGRTGALLTALSEDLGSPKLRLLSGGRMAVAGIAGASARLLFFEGEKGPARSIDLGPAASVVLGGEIGPGRIAVALNPFRSNDETARKAWKLAVVNVTEGKVDSHFSGLVPADRFSWWFSPILSPAEAGSPASKLFLEANGALVRLDPASGKQEILLGGKR
jgi:hypothetical protein